MKKYFKALILILFCLAVLLPFTSNAPDGLEKVNETFGIEEHEPLWKGIMPDYTLPTIDNPYVSTLFAGIFGVFLVSGFAFILGTAMGKSNRREE